MTPNDKLSGLAKRNLPAYLSSRIIPVRKSSQAKSLLFPRTARSLLLTVPGPGAS